MENKLTTLVRSLYPFAYSVVSDQNDLALKKFKEYLDFNIHEYSSGSEINGWIVPNSWTVSEAKIFYRGELLLDAAQNPLGVGSLSPSFCGKVSRETLRDHLFFSEAQPEHFPYHWTNLYRPSEKKWSFCVSREFYDLLVPGEYEVRLITRESRGSMKVLDYLLRGATDKQIIINAHNCHPWQANDDISGCAVGISLIKRLAKLKHRRFTYRLIIAPELIGTVHWLNEFGNESSDFAGAILIKSVGNEGLLKLQKSFNGYSQLDRAAEVVLRDSEIPHEIGDFRTIYGNDETVFDSPGYEIPTISFTRFPFPQYHTSADTPDSLKEEALSATVKVIYETCTALEESKSLIFAHRGLVSLSNPRYDLYRAAPAPGIDKMTKPKLTRQWNLLMNCLPRELTGKNSAIDLALKYEIPIRELCRYLNDWEIKGLAFEQTKNCYVDKTKDF